jgi:DNA invertase Pin-like site-specific DNA recombinase
MAHLKEGDVVLVTKLDRLGRSIREPLDLIERIGKGHLLVSRLLSTLLAAIAE